MYCNVAGGELPDGKQFTLKASGARHHPRWMSKVIYTIKIAMLQHQLKNDIPEHFLKKIVAVAQFFCLYYFKSWSRTPLHFQALSDDLNLYKTLLTNAKYHKSEDIQQFNQAAATKFESHLWYLTERLVVLSLFSDASIQQKRTMAKQMKKFKKKSFKTTEPTVQQMPIVTSSTQMKDLFAPESWLLFKLINEQPMFLSKPAFRWEQDENYQQIKSRLLHLKVVNDSSERALGLVRDYHQCVVTKSRTQKQFFYQVVKNLRERQNNLLIKPNAERCTKKILSKMW